jgi:hypothetical protein
VAPAAYRFLDRWHVPAPVEAAFDVVTDTLAYPRWWGDVFLEATGDGGPPRPGRRTHVVARGFLPYRLRFTLTDEEIDAPTRALSRLSGDFEGSGEWRLAAAGHGTDVELDWRPAVTKPLVRDLTPLLRPLFRANHDWTMRRGQEHVVPELRRRAEAS